MEIHVLAAQPAKITIPGAQAINLAQIIRRGHSAGLDCIGFEMFIRHVAGPADFESDGRNPKKRGNSLLGTSFRNHRVSVGNQTSQTVPNPTALSPRKGKNELGSGVKQCRRPLFAVDLDKSRRLRIVRLEDFASSTSDCDHADGNSERHRQSVYEFCEPCDVRGISHSRSG